MLSHRKKKKGIINHFKNLSTADKLAYTSVLITIVFGIWGIALTYKVLNTSVEVSHFDSLLNKTDSSVAKQAQILSENNTLVSLTQTQIDSLVSINKTLTNEFAVISKQYALNLAEQKIFDSNTENINSSNEAKFYVATQNLWLLIWQPRLQPYKLSEWDLNLKIDFLNKANEILNNQLDNPFLLSNRLMLNDWISARDSIVWYIADLNFLPQQPKDTLTLEV